MRNVSGGSNRGTTLLGHSALFHIPHSAFRILRIPFLPMNYETLLFDLKDGVALLTINRPDTLNALNDQVLEELGSAAERLAREDPLEGGRLTGAGRKARVGGADSGAR